ncbi:MAG: YbaN family protein [Saccharospirillum sp.]|uniref:YbaN family protein n=1 Tax=Saccharospirillum sp. TaxID=2033801 RepID=UPI00349FF609
MHRAVLRWVLFVAGWVCVALGTVGVVMPVLPTTPFLLLAAACFARSSPRFHRWLLSTKLFGPLIENWQRERYIEKRSKRVALVVVALTFTSSILIVEPIALKWMLVGFWATCTFFIGRLSTIPRSQRGGPQQSAVVTEQGS